jgi:hypothetical protein
MTRRLHPERDEDRHLAAVPDPNPLSRPRYRITKMTERHGAYHIAAEWSYGTARARLVAAPQRSLAVPGEPFTAGQWTSLAWATYLVWEDGDEPLNGGLLERHHDRITDKVTWHPVGSASVTDDLAAAVRLVLSITDARTWEA